MSKPVLAIRIKDPEHAVRVQNTLFTLGYFWYNGVNQHRLIQPLDSNEYILLHNSIYLNKLMRCTDILLRYLAIYSYLPAEDKDLAKYLLLGEIVYETK
jgi:hypothetical protein